MVPSHLRLRFTWKQVPLIVDVWSAKMGTTRSTTTSTCQSRCLVFPQHVLGTTPLRIGQASPRRSTSSPGRLPFSFQEMDPISMQNSSSIHQGGGSQFLAIAPWISAPCILSHDFWMCQFHQFSPPWLSACRHEKPLPVLPPQVQKVRRARTIVLPSSLNLPLLAMALTDTSIPGPARHVVSLWLEPAK